MTQQASLGLQGMVLPEPVWRALEFHPALFRKAVQGWVDGALPVSDLVLVLECRADGAVRVRASQRARLLASVPEQVAWELRRFREDAVPVYYVLQGAPWESCSLLWLNLREVADTYAVFAPRPDSKPRARNTVTAA